MKYKVALAVAFVLLSVLCPAPIKQLPPKGQQLPPMSMSQEELARQQAEQQRINEVGKVPERTESTFIPDSQSAASAADTLRTASVDPAKDVIKKASQNLEAKKSRGSSPWIFASVMLLIGLGVVFAFRQWAEKNVPMPQDKSKKQVW